MTMQHLDLRDMLSTGESKAALTLLKAHPHATIPAFMSPVPYAVKNGHPHLVDLLNDPRLVALVAEQAVADALNERLQHTNVHNSSTAKIVKLLFEKAPVETARLMAFAGQPGGWCFPEGVAYLGGPHAAASFVVLHKHGALNADQRTKHGTSLLHLALLSKRWTSDAFNATHVRPDIQWLLEHGADAVVMERDFMKDTAVDMARRRGFQQDEPATFAALENIQLRMEWKAQDLPLAPAVVRVRL